MSSEYDKYKTLEKIKDDLEELQETPVRPQSFECRECETPIQRLKARHEMEAADVGTAAFAIIAFVLPLFMPSFEVAWLFGVGLLFSLLTRSLLARLATIIFTAVYFILMIVVGSYFEMADIWNFLFSVNTISLVPVIVGTCMTVVAMGGGAIHGGTGSTRYAGIYIIALALVISIADTAIAVFYLGATDWLLILTTHLAVYIVAFLIAWGIWYLPVRLAREGVIRATR